MRYRRTLLTLAVFGVVASGFGQRLRADEANSKHNPAWVDQRIDDWQPSKAERAFHQIGWAKDIGEAKRLAKEHGRPIFLFTYDGASLSNFRC
jgi:hypothetical protein